MAESHIKKGTQLKCRSHITKHPVRDSDRVSYKKVAATYSPTWWGSTIGDGELNFSVRNGKRWILTAITATIYVLRKDISVQVAWGCMTLRGHWRQSAHHRLRSRYCHHGTSEDIIHLVSQTLHMGCRHRIFLRTSFLPACRIHGIENDKNKNSVRKTRENTARAMGDCRCTTFYRICNIYFFTLIRK